MRRALLLSLAVLAVGLAGCSSEAQTFETFSELRGAVSSAGVPCDRTEPGPEASLVDESGICVGSQVSLFMFDGSDDLENWRKVGTRLGPALVGPNWAITGERQEIDLLAEELGGELISGF